MYSKGQKFAFGAKLRVTGEASGFYCLWNLFPYLLLQPFYLSLKETSGLQIEPSRLAAPTLMWTLVHSFLESYIREVLYWSFSEPLDVQDYILAIHFKFGKIKTNLSGQGRNRFSLSTLSLSLLPFLPPFFSLNNFGFIWTK